MRHVTLLGLLPRVFVEMAIGYSINLEVLDKMEVALKFVNYMEKNSSSKYPAKNQQCFVAEVVTDASASIKKMMCEFC